MFPAWTPFLVLTLNDRSMIGRHVSQYIIKEQLGRGGMGIVYRARDTKLDRDVALKFLPPELSAAEDSKARFVQEAKAASALDHPNICTIYEISESEDGKLFIAMSYYDGQTLKYLLDEGAMSESKAAGIALQIAEGLSKAHGAGITHRDIKPANIMVTAEGRVKILDFGLAKLEQGLDLTKAGSTVGTTAYMSPEQASGKEVDGRTDIWSLGVILYEMLSGDKAFGGGYDQAVLYSVMNEDPEPLDGIGAGLADAVTGMMKKNPEERFRSAEEVIAALDPFASGTSRTVPADIVSASNFPLKWIGVVVALLLVSLILIVAWPVSTPEQGIEEGLVVLPFNIQGGEDLDYLRNGLVYLISDRLDGLFPLRIVDPNAIVAKADRRSAGTYDADTGRQFASAMGQSHFMVGSAAAAGPGLVLFVSIYDNEKVQYAVRAEIDDASLISSAVDDIARQILTHEYDESSRYLASMIGRAGGSYGAMRAYLEGVEALKRQDFRAARNAGIRAIQEDSTYAMGYYLKGRATSWLMLGDSHEDDYRTALQFSESLSPRLVRYLELELNPSTSGYQSLLLSYPEMLDARGRMADWMYHRNPYRFQPSAESIPYFLEALKEDPNNREYASHIVSFAAKGYGPVSLDSVIHLVGDGSPYKFLAANTQERDSLTQQIVEGNDRAFRYWETAYTAEDFDMARRMVVAGDQIADQSTDSFSKYLAILINVHQSLAEGRFGDFHDNLTLLEPRAEGHRLSIKAVSYQSPFFEGLGDSLVAVVDRISRLDTTRIRLTTNNRAFGGVPAGETRDIQLYLQGIVAARRGDSEAVVSIAERLVERADYHADSTFARSFAARLNGYAEATEENWEGALEYFNQGFRRKARSSTNQSWWETDAPARWIRGQVLSKLGRTEEAIASIQSIHDGWGWIEWFWLGPIYLQRGQWEEELGQTEKAIDTYSRFLDLMESADPQFDEQKAFVRARLNSLITAESGG